LGEFGEFLRGEFAFKTIQQPVDHLALSLIHRGLAVDAFPDPCLLQNARQTLFRPRNGTSQTT
jgi:hypothetical protein